MKQFIALTLATIADIPNRSGSVIVVVVGIAGVVAVLTFVLTMSSALRNTIEGTGRDDWAIILRDGAVAESLSAIPRDAVPAIDAIVRSTVTLKAPAKRDPTTLDPQLVVSVTLPRIEQQGLTGSILMRGTTNQSVVRTPDFELLDGRMFNPGRHEIIVGDLAHRQYPSLGLGSELAIKGVTWRVVGRFTTAGTAFDSEILSDLPTAMSAFKRTAYSSVRAHLSGKTNLEAVAAALDADPRTKVDIMQETEYFQVGSSQALIGFVTYVVAAIMAVGAIFAALNIMHAAVIERTKELATLRTIGFAPLPIIASVLAESMLIALLGGVLGLLLCGFAIHGSTFTTGSLTSMTTDLRVSPAIALISIAAGCIIGFIGGLAPAIHAATRPIAEGLRAEN